MDTLFGNKTGRYMHFGLVIVDTSLLKEVHEGKARKTIVTECNQCLIRVFDKNRVQNALFWLNKGHIL